MDPKNVVSKQKHHRHCAPLHSNKTWNEDGMFDGIIMANHFYLLLSALADYACEIFIIYKVMKYRELLMK